MKDHVKLEKRSQQSRFESSKNYNNKHHKECNWVPDVMARILYIDFEILGSFPPLYIIRMRFIFFLLFSCGNLERKEKSLQL